MILVDHYVLLILVPIDYFNSSIKLIKEHEIIFNKLRLNLSDPILFT